MLDDLLAQIAPVDAAARAAATAHHASLAKPPGSLGRLEEVAAQLAAIAGRCPAPVPDRPAAVVAAGDHGVHAQGVSDWPQAITGAMVRTVAGGDAAVNAIARTVDAQVLLLDVGTAGDGPVPVGVRDARLGAGTADHTLGPAMDRSTCLDAIAAGAAAARDLLRDGADLLAVGELGIANTTAAAALIAAITGAAPADIVGPGANADGARVGRKVEVVTTALDRHGGDRTPLAFLASLGGFEHAALVGVILAGAAARVPVVLDGISTNAAALVAVGLAPAAGGYLIASHTSVEPGASVALDALGLRALFDLQLRLGEGTGAVLAVPLVQAAARVLAEVATIDQVVAGH